MNYKAELEKFVKNGYEKNHTQFITDGSHNFVLKNKKDNFISVPPKDFKYQTWAASLKSSQAFAYNVFSGIDNPTLRFEFPMKAFTTAAQIDVMFEDVNSQTIMLFEVKAFEVNHIGENKIEFKDVYFSKDEYYRSDIAVRFIEFLNTVIKSFENQKIYGDGIKQLCCHLLGILNTMNKEGYNNKKFKLYSFCLDNLFHPIFERDVKNYKEVLAKFKNIVDELLKDIKVDSCIEYCGFISASEYVKSNGKRLGEKNYNYVMKRYFYKN